MLVTWHVPCDFARHESMAHNPSVVRYRWTNWVWEITSWSLETSEDLPIILEESIEEYISNEWKQNRKMSTCNRLDLESLGSWPTMPQKLPGHCSRDSSNHKVQGWNVNVHDELHSGANFPEKSVVILCMEQRKSIIRGSFQWWTICRNFRNIKKMKTQKYFDVWCLFTTFYPCPCEHEDNECDLGPLDTRTKSYDPEIVRVQKKVSKGRPKTLPKSCSVVT